MERSYAQAVPGHNLLAVAIEWCGGSEADCVDGDALDRLAMSFEKGGSLKSYENNKPW